MENLIYVLAVMGAAAFAVAAGFVATGTWSFVKDWDRRHPERMVECHTCHRQLPARKAVVVASNVQPFMDGGSAMIAEYCKRHAPK